MKAFLAQGSNFLAKPPSASACHQYPATRNGGDEGDEGDEGHESHEGHEGNEGKKGRSEIAGLRGHPGEDDWRPQEAGPHHEQAREGDVEKDAREREESLLPHQGLACGGHQSQAGTRGQWFYCHWRQEAGGQGALCQGQGNPRGEVEAMNRDLAVGAAGLCRDSRVVVLPRPGCPSCTFTFENKKKKKDKDGIERGVPGSFEMLNQKELSTQPIISFDWHMNKTGLCVFACLDQTCRV